MNVIKRDKSVEEFDQKKIESVLRKVFKNTKHNAPVKNAKEVASLVFNKCLVLDYDIPVEKVQDIIRDSLVEMNYPIEAKEFIIYRNERATIRKFVKEKEEFINRYKKSNNTANATIDDNSNVASKNIGVLNTEIHKPNNIQTNRGMVMNRLKTLFPNFDYKQYLQDIDDHIIYKHDESTFAFGGTPYTYSSKEVINVKYNEHKLLIPFDSLWNIIEEDEVLVDSDNEVYQKYPENLFVLDRNGIWTNITHVTKKKRHRDLVRVKTSFGEDVVVTDNHPMIVDLENIDKNVQAIDSFGYNQFKIGTNQQFNGDKSIDVSICPYVSEATSSYCFNQNEHTNCWCKRYITVDWNLGYFIGFFIGDGNYENNENNIHFTQNDRSTLIKLNNIIFDILGVAGRIYTKKEKYNCYTLDISSDFLYWLLKDYFNIQDKSENKTIPFNIWEFNEDFAKGIICGLIDADGTVNGCQLTIRLSSRACILQCTELLRYFGYGVGNIHTALPFSNNNSYHTNYSLWGVNCSVRNNSIPLGDSIKLKSVRTSNNTPKYKFSGTTNIVSVERLSDEDSFVKSNEYIYDITTETHSFALNNLLVHNCCSISMYPFLINGLKYLGGLSKAPKNLDSYCGMYINLIFAISAQFAGAVATSEFFVYFNKFAEMEFGDDYTDHFDEFYRIGPTLRKIMNKSGKWFKNVRDLAVYDFNDDELNKMRDDIVFESERPMTDDELKEWLDDVLNGDYTQTRYSLKDNSRTIRSQIHQCFQQVVYSINQPAAARGLQAAFVNFSYFDKAFFEGMFGEFYFPDGAQPQWKTLNWLQKDFMMWFNEERTKTMLTFPVESFALVNIDGKWLDEENAKFVADEYARGHSFFTYISDTVDSLSSCCRLKNKIQTKEFNFTNGNMGIMTGSKSVITLNLNRITQDVHNKWIDKEISNELPFYDFLKTELCEILERVYKYHTAYNSLLKDMYDADLLPAYKAGFINLDKQYLTIGLNGLNEAAEFLGMECRPNDDDYKQFCQLIFSTIKEQNNAHKTKELTFNTEQVPAESLAIKNYNWDKEDGYVVPEDRNLYASYIFIPSDDSLSVLDKIKMHGNEYIGDYLDGGSAAHINLLEHLSANQYSRILDYAVKVGCQYLTFNVPNAECSCGYIAKTPIKVCPKCGGTHISYYDRIIGYLTKIDNWSEGRQLEQKTRVYVDAKDNI